MNDWVERLKSRASRRELSNHFCGETPLHEACYSGCSVHSVIDILRLWPAQIACKDSCGRTPLHWALATKKHHDKARELLLFWKTTEQHQPPQETTSSGIGNGNDNAMLKKALLQKCDLGYTALDHACSNDAPSTIIKELLMHCPELASMVRTGTGRTPLHMLIVHARSKELPLTTTSTKLLLDVYPQAVMMRDREGNLPLHYCVGYKQIGMNLDSFRLVLDATTKLSCTGTGTGTSTGTCSIHTTTMDKMRNELGHLPLHCASKNNAPVPVINALMDAYPMSLTSVDWEGNTALHLACKQGDRTSYILKSRLVDGMDGESVIWGMVNDKGLLPLQTCSNLDSWFELLRLVPHCIRNHTVV